MGITAVIAALCFARLAGAHTLGISTCDFEAKPDGSVDARFVFASAEPLHGVRLDRDGDGVVTDDDVRGARSALAAFLHDGVDVTADGEDCPESFGGASISDVDGLVLTASFACPRGASRLEATLYFLTALRPEHREVARITAGSATAEAVLTRDRRLLALTLPGAARSRAASRRGRRAAWIAAAVAVLALGTRAWRRRARR